MRFTEFTTEDNQFLGNTPYRWIESGKSLVSYRDTDLTISLEEELEERGFIVHHKGIYTTQFAKVADQVIVF